MQRVTPDRPWPLHDAAAIRRIEQAAAATLPPHTLMQRAGLATARLAFAIAPHARTVWIACGPGNNGGDGFEAALHLRHGGKAPVVTWIGDESRMPPDAAASLARARAAGVAFAPEPPPSWDLAIDALLGIGGSRAPEGALLAQVGRMNEGGRPVLAIDVPSGLDADTGRATDVVRASHTLGLVALKPGLFTGLGRDACGELWFDDLQVAADEPAAAVLNPPPPAVVRPHASHKGSHGDVAVIGGAPGMAGAALLAARAALHQGAGRVFLGFLDPAAPAFDLQQPDLMVRRWDTLDLHGMAVACGCGGGEAVREALPQVLRAAHALVLDADGLNAIAADPQLAALLQARGRRGAPTVLTPHPLEAARLLETGTREVQADRPAAARRLARQFGAVVVLKGSGTVIASDDGALRINPTGNARLAIAGTGDVLAGMIAARLGGGETAFDAACGAVYLHGLAADRWPAGLPLTAAVLASS